MEKVLCVHCTAS